MRRIVMFLAGTATAVVLLFGYHTSTAGALLAATPTAGASSSSATSGNSAGGGTSAPGGSSPGGDTGSDTAGTRTVTGPSVPTQWGPVQVQLTLTGDRITDVTVLQQPDGNPRDAEINSYALPILVQSTLDAQSADVDMVSGATVTSVGYLQSLQAALDQAAV